jgi:hypothetical protein
MVSIPTNTRRSHQALGVLCFGCGTSQRLQWPAAGAAPGRPVRWRLGELSGLRPNPDFSCPGYRQPRPAEPHRPGADRGPVPIKLIWPGTGSMSSEAEVIQCLWSYQTLVLSEERDRLRFGCYAGTSPFQEVGAFQEFTLCTSRGTDINFVLFWEPDGTKLICLHGP